MIAATHLTFAPARCPLIVERFDIATIYTAIVVNITVVQPGLPHQAAGFHITAIPAATGQSTVHSKGRRTRGDHLLLQLRTPG